MGWVLLFAVCGLSLRGEDGVPSSSSPFLRLRDSTLNYHGPTSDLSVTHEFRIGWFGPAEGTNQAALDLWCAASLAIQYANPDPAGNSDCASSESTPPDSRLRSPNSELRTPVSELRTPVSELRTPVSELRTPVSELRTPVPPFRLIPRWAPDPWGTGVSQLARMVYEEHPVALLGSIDSASTHLAEQIVAKANLLLVSPVTSDPSVTLAGVSWMFACAPSDAAIARALVGDLLAVLEGVSGGRIALLNTTDHESRMAARECVRELTRRRAAPEYRFEVKPGTAELDAHRAALQRAEPDVVIILAGEEESARWVRELRGLSFSTPPLIYGGASMARSSFSELAGSAAEGVRFPLPAVLQSDHPDAARFVTAFTAQRGYAPDYAALLTYDATRFLTAAIRRSGPNRVRARAALIELSPWSGLAGVIRFDGTGHNPRTDIPVATLRQGRLVLKAPCSNLNRSS